MEHSTQIVVDALFRGNQVRAVGSPDDLRWVAQDVKHAAGARGKRPWKPLASKHRSTAWIAGQSQTVLGRAGLEQMLRAEESQVCRETADDLLAWCDLKAHEALDRATAPERRPEQMALPCAAIAPVSTVALVPDATPAEAFTDDARDVYRGLGLTMPFAHWIKSARDRFGFVEGVDFVRVLSTAREGRGGQNRVDYRLTDAATKRIQANDRGEVGEAARGGLIAAHGKLEQIERVWNDDAAFLAEAALRSSRIIQGLRLENAALTDQVAEAAPIVNAMRQLSASAGSHTIRAAAKELGVEQRRFECFMLDKRYIFVETSCDYRKPEGYLAPYAESTKAGILESVPVVIDAKLRDPQTRVTGEGLKHFKLRIDAIREHEMRRRVRAESEVRQ